MQTLKGTIEGPFSIDRDLEIRGTIIGDATVWPNSTVHLVGTITGNLTIEKGGSAVVYGRVEGRVHKRGGRWSSFIQTREAARFPNTDFSSTDSR